MPTAGDLGRDLQLKAVARRPQGDRSLGCEVNGAGTPVAQIKFFTAAIEPEEASRSVITL
jgi:hypothetical protein